MPKTFAVGRKLLIGALLCAGLLILMLRFFEHSQVYHPGRDMDATGAELGRPFENVTFQTPDGLKLNGWFYPAATNASRSNLVFLICHGNGGNISDRLDLYSALLGAGAGVFAFDYRGYGRSQGRPSEAGTYTDAQAAYDWLRHKGYPGNHIVLYGESLGGGVVTELSLRAECRALILQSTFTSIPAIGAEFFPWLPVRWLGTIRYDNRAKLPRVKSPVLIMHSRQDDLVRFHHAEDNFAAAHPPKFLCEIKGTHSDPLADRAIFQAGIQKFLQSLDTP